MTERYDHRDDEARADDETKNETTGAPVMSLSCVALLIVLLLG